MSVDDCEIALQRTAADLCSLLEPLGFKFQLDQAGHAHQSFATGFFVRGELKIGLIYREQASSAITLGSVNYENDTTNASHDQLMSWLGLVARQRLRYDEATFASMAADDGSVIDALRGDLVTLSSVLSDEVMLTQAIGEARRKADQSEAEWAARQAAKREEWLQRRRGNKE
jgi:hypothetical protein